MSAAIPIVEPEKITAGDTIEWKKTLADYSPSTWTLKYAFRGPQVINIVTTADGSAHKVSESAATTADWKPGNYFWQSYVESGSSRKTIARGQMIVLENLSSVTDEAFDGRSQAQKILDAIRAVLQKKASRIQEEYEIDGVRIKDMPLEQLLPFEDKYAQYVAAEKAAENLQVGRPGRRRILTRFTR